MSGADRRRRPVTRRSGLLVLMAVVVVAADQWTKSWAEDALSGGRSVHLVGPARLVLTENTGAAFSLGSGATPVVELLAIVLVAGVLWQSGRLARSGGRMATMAGLSLLAAGALSNLGDRLFRHNHGAVVDFVQLVGWWPVFNLADVAVTVRAAMVAVSFAFPKAKPGQAGQAAPLGAPSQRPGGQARAAGRPGRDG